MHLYVTSCRSHNDNEHRRPIAVPVVVPVAVPVAVPVPSSTTISSSRNPLIRRVIRLRDNRFRQREAAVLVDGVREIERALAAGLTLRSLFVAEPPSEHAPLLAAAGAAVTWVTPEILRQIAYGDNPRGAVAVFAAPPPRTLQTLQLPADPLVVILVGIEKPGNAGAVFRSADAVGADAVILCQCDCDLFNPNLIRSSLGTVFSLPSATAGQDETIRWLGEQRIRAFAAIVGATRTFWEADYRGATALVLGSEAQGLGEAWRPAQHASSPAADNGVPAASAAGELTAVSIPMLGIADSLNVSVTAAALLFEARRQRLRR